MEKKYSHLTLGKKHIEPSVIKKNSGLLIMKKSSLVLKDARNSFNYTKYGQSTPVKASYKKGPYNICSRTAVSLQYRP